MQQCSTSESTVTLAELSPQDYPVFLDSCMLLSLFPRLARSYATSESGCSLRLVQAAECFQPCGVASGLCMHLNVLRLAVLLQACACSCILPGFLCRSRHVRTAECSQARCVASGLWEAAQPICSSGDATERWLVAAPRAAGPHQGPAHRDLPITCSGAHLPARAALPF